MEWFKHDSNASNDAKVKKLLIRYGTTGYAIYFHCLELICGDVSKTNITFELEHDSEIIADNLKIKGTSEKSGIQIVEEIMKYIIELGLFESDGNRIFCYKLLKRIDTSMTSNMNFRKLIIDAKNNEHHDGVMTGSCKKEENRKNRKKDNKNSAKKKYGEYKNILLTDDEYTKLEDKVDNRDYWIKEVDEGIELKGYTYKSHYLAILRWYRDRDKYKPYSITENQDEIYDKKARDFYNSMKGAV